MVNSSDSASLLGSLLGVWDRTDLLERILAEGAGAVPELVRSFTVAGLARRASPLLVVLPRSRDAEAFARAVGVWMPPEDAVLFPAWEVLPGEAMSPTLETMGRRIKVLRDLARGGAGGPKVVVASVRAFLQRAAEPADQSIRLAPGAAVSIAQLAEELVAFGYERNYLVERPGEFSVRGGIVDIFPADHSAPIRADFFGDEITELKTFSVSSQRSRDDVAQAELFPCRELRPTDSVRAKAAELAAETQDSARGKDLSRISEGLAFEGMEAYLGLLETDLKPLTDFLPPGGRVVICDPKQCRDRAGEFLEQAAHWGGDQSSTLFGDFEEVVASAEKIELSSFAVGDEAPGVDVKGWDEYSGRVDLLTTEIRGLMKEGVTIVVAAGAGAERARQVLAEAGLGLPMQAPHLGAAVVTQVSVTTGFALTLDGTPALAVIGESDLFGRRRPVRTTLEEAPAKATALLLELAPGDYVVHEVYGVGRYHGMTKREIAGVSRDYLIISYHGDDRLYLPTEQLDAITKYSGGDSPRLNRLGSSEWEKSKSRAKRAVEDIAQELLVLYSSRIATVVQPFSADSVWQAELEASFPYVETPDQARAIDQVKQDMEKPVPMDRVICGDVGFGKTEVAVRAAFKAVQDSRQVAVLVPTTILAQQHHQTFNERFAGFPIQVRQLSRFLNATEQDEALEALASGKADVVIGTHRLLQNDVKFHDLGLLVVDEEQRFGVKHKERIKQLRTSVDVLTMTATPIPRTLEMSIAGIRDLSLMDTAPADRRPVLTYVGETDYRMVTAAIRRELARDGQVFYVHNRVRSIRGAARRISGLVPGARVQVAHGQMAETELERVMVDVWDGKVDVLVCTTIIESGLDIPAMNTLIVERADLLGLAQLYQLRGRVGRARERAYGYFFYPHSTVLTAEAHERLKTLSEYTELGSGFKIALRDLEIRGAGNILGAQQSGHIAAVGFDLYMRMMSEAVAGLSGSKPAPKLQVRLEIPANAYIDSAYIERESLRMDAYRQIERVRNPGDAEALRYEFSDRYGPVPGPMENLLIIAELRAFLADHGVAEVTTRDGLMKLRPFPLLEDSQLRVLAGLSPQAEYRAASETLLLPAPPADVAPWALQSLRAILRETS